MPDGLSHDGSVSASGRLAEVWAAYVDAEQAGLRSSALSLLGEFCAALNDAPAVTRHDWASAIAAAVVDDREPIPLRHALVRELLAPELSDGVVRHEPGHARWLALAGKGTDQEAWFSGLPEELRGLRPLLEQAIADDPTDTVARSALGEEIVRGWEYTMHEVPSGVLFDNNGATAEQCDQMLLELERDSKFLLSLAEDEGTRASNSRLVSLCRFHLTEYASYLRTRSGLTSYAEFLGNRTP